LAKRRLVPPQSICGGRTAWDRSPSQIDSLGHSTWAGVHRRVVRSGPTNEADADHQLGAQVTTPGTSAGHCTHSNQTSRTLYGSSTPAEARAFVCNVAPGSRGHRQGRGRPREAEERRKRRRKEGCRVGASRLPLPLGRAPGAFRAPRTRSCTSGKDEVPGRPARAQVFTGHPGRSRWFWRTRPSAPRRFQATAVISQLENNQSTASRILGLPGRRRWAKDWHSQSAQDGAIRSTRRYYFPWIQGYDPERGTSFVGPSGQWPGITGAQRDSERGACTKGAPAKRDRPAGGWGSSTPSSRPEQEFSPGRRDNCFRNYGADRGTQRFLGAGARLQAIRPGAKSTSSPGLFDDGTEAVRSRSAPMGGVSEPNDEDALKARSPRNTSRPSWLAHLQLGAR